MQTRELVATGKAIVKKVQRDQLTDRAAAMTYYTLMALFPGLLLGVSVLGLIGQGSLYQDMIDKVRDVAPAELVQPLEDFLASATSNDAAGITFAIALVIGLNGASGALAAAGRSLNVVLGVQDDRGLLHRKLHDMGWTLPADRPRHRVARADPARRPARGVGLRPDRARRHRRDGLDLAALAAGDPRDDARLRDRLPRRARTPTSAASASSRPAP